MAAILPGVGVGGGWGGGGWGVGGGGVSWMNLINTHNSEYA